jgi:hypothetical protein
MAALLSRHELTPLLKQRASAVTEILTPQQKKLLIDLERAGQKSKKPASSTKRSKQACLLNHCLGLDWNSNSELERNPSIVVVLHIGYAE